MNVLNMEKPYNVLVVDDEQSILTLFKKEFGNDYRSVTMAMTGAQARELVRRHSFDVIVLDIRLPDVDGVELLAEFKHHIPDVEIIMITGHGNIDTAVEAMKAGAYDYITKPFHLDKLELLLDRAYQRACLQRENRGFRHSQSSSNVPRLVGSSPPIQEIRRMMQKVAPTNVPVLLTGESGSGKDVVAHNIHAMSDRAQKPMIVKNCATLQKELARSELFGHTRGSFTGATEDREGLMTFAHTGVLFLDEIGELPLEVQASLLRVLESHNYRRVGEKEERQVDVRFLFATNRNLAREVEQGRFHEALFHRINIIDMKIPPLRERKEDIPLLVERFLWVLKRGPETPTITERAMGCLMNYDWPGNIRELRNVIERSLILSNKGTITHHALPPEIVGHCTGENGEDEVAALNLERVERQHIANVLAMFAGNRQKTADMLGIGRKTLYRKIQKYHLE